jgi:hypothetical protein
MARYAAMPFLKVWYSRIDIDEVSRQFDQGPGKVVHAA